jgi:hypothetical protein
MPEKYRITASAINADTMIKTMDKFFFVPIGISWFIIMNR